MNKKLYNNLESFFDTKGLQDFQKNRAFFLIQGAKVKDMVDIFQRTEEGLKSSHHHIFIKFNTKNRLELAIKFIEHVCEKLFLQQYPKIEKDAVNERVNDIIDKKKEAFIKKLTFWGIGNIPSTLLKDLLTNPVLQQIALEHKLTYKQLKYKKEVIFRVLKIHNRTQLIWKFVLYLHNMELEQPHTALYFKYKKQERRTTFKKIKLPPPKKVSNEAPPPSKFFNKEGTSTESIPILPVGAK